MGTLRDAVPFCDGYFRCTEPECNAFGRGGRGYLRARDCARACADPQNHLCPDVSVPYCGFPKLQHPRHFITPDADGPRIGGIDISSVDNWNPGSKYTRFCLACQQGMKDQRRALEHPHKQFVRRLDPGASALQLIPASVREAVSSVVYKHSMGSVPLRHWITKGSISGSIVRLECLNMPCGHIWKKQCHPPEVGHSVVEFDPKSGQLLLCCTARTCVHFRYPLLDKPLVIAESAGGGASGTEVKHAGKRKRPAKLAWCDGKYRCVECHPKGIKNRLGARACKSPDQHMLTGLPSDGVIHPFMNGKAIVKGKAKMQKLLDDMTDMCGVCRGALVDFKS
jgi:hypothetical protein